MTFNDAVWRVLLTAAVADLARAAAMFAAVSLVVALLFAIAWAFSDK